MVPGDEADGECARVFSTNAAGTLEWFLIGEFSPSWGVSVIRTKWTTINAIYEDLEYACMNIHDSPKHILQTVDNRNLWLPRNYTKQASNRGICLQALGTLVLVVANRESRGRKPPFVVAREREFIAP